MPPDWTMRNLLEFEIPFEPPLPRTFSWFRFGKKLAVISLAGWFLWVLISIFQNEGQRGPIETIYAAPGAIKVKPETPGGLKIPHQGISVYCMISECD